eukprot:TRINITY_DN5091_c0_g1_i1.p1 TRINITY_DN5091_c0_g1~~TRINITY_DN5091_c0_g1_i1.p1  ORF type:complete len:708 (+),score=196.90 TRINITY_DN5091_c0_g1_i1:28-2124(+)
MDDPESHPRVLLDDSSTYGSERSLLLDSRSNKNGNPFTRFREEPHKLRWLASQITPARVRTGIVLVVLIVMMFLFSTERERGNGLHLKAVSQQHPIIIYAVDDDPIEVLQVKIRVEQFEDLNATNTWLVNVTLQAQDPSTGGGYEDQETWAIDLSDLSEVASIHYFYTSNSNLAYRFVVTTNWMEPVGLTFVYYNLPWLVKYQVIFAALTLVMVYILIIFELVHRTLAAFFGSFVALALLSKLHSRPTLIEVVSWIDFDTCGLLFGMMVMVGIFSQTGFFEWSAVKAYKWSKGNIWRLIVMLCTFTAVISAFLDNVTTILLITPVTIRLCKVLEIPPQQMVIALVMFSNLGGTATAVGDPPNIIIVNDSQIKASGRIDFMNFSFHMAPGVLLACAACYFVIKRLSKPLIYREPNMNKRQEVEIWKKTAHRLHDDNPDELVVKKKLEEHIMALEKELASSPSIVQSIDVESLEAKYRIHDWPLFVNSCLVLTIVILLFFLHSAANVHLSLAWIAIIGSMAHLLVSGIRDIEEVLEKVEFATLLFFAGLFILMKALEELGLIDWIGENVAHAVSMVAPGYARLTVAVLIILWVSGIVSAFIDNIPYTAAMVPVVYGLGTGDLGLPLTPLVYALAFGTCFGGNGTLIGASANVVACGISETQGYPIKFTTFFRTGFPVMLASLMTSTVYLIIFHVVIPWDH